MLYSSCKGIYSSFSLSLEEIRISSESRASCVTDKTIIHSEYYGHTFSKTDRLFGLFGTAKNVFMIG